MKVADSTVRNGWISQSNGRNSQIIEGKYWDLIGKDILHGQLHLATTSGQDYLDDSIRNTSLGTSSRPGWMGL